LICAGASSIPVLQAMANAVRLNALPDGSADHMDAQREGQDVMVSWEVLAFGCIWFGFSL